MFLVYYILVDKKVVEVKDVLEWAKFFGSPDRFLKNDFFPNGVRVSTIFLGIDHNFGDGPPLFFETMVFDINKKTKYSSLGESIDTDRYSTYDQALAGHEAMVAKYGGRQKLAWWMEVLAVLIVLIPIALFTYLLFKYYAR